jgi:hypothetical protein
MRFEIFALASLAECGIRLQGCYSSTYYYRTHVGLFVVLPPRPGRPIDLIARRRRQMVLVAFSIQCCLIAQLCDSLGC